MTVALVVATAAARGRVYLPAGNAAPGGGSGAAENHAAPEGPDRPAPEGQARAGPEGSSAGAGPARGPQASRRAGGAVDGGSGSPATAATAQPAAGLPLLSLHGGVVTTQPLLTRLCGQLGALGVSDIVVIAPHGHAGPLAAMAWDGLSPPGSPAAAGFDDAGNIDVIECFSLADELRAVAAVARRVGASGDAILVCAGDVVAHTEALARLCRGTGTGALTDSPARQDDLAGHDVRPALRLAGGEPGRSGRYAGKRGAGRDGGDAALDDSAAGHSARRAVVAAGSAFHRVHAPNAVGCGVFVVSARDGEELAVAADEFSVLAANGLSAPPRLEFPGTQPGRHGTGAQDTAAMAGQGSAAVPALRHQAGWPGSRYRSVFSDSPALLLVGLVRRGVGVEAVDASPLVCVRAQTAQQVRAAAAELAAVDEDRVRLDAAVRRGGGLVATCVVNPFATYLARAAHRRRLSPNALTGMSMGLGLLAAAWFSAGTSAGLVLGAAFGFAAFLVACADGQLARYARQQAAFGAWLAGVGGRLTEFAVYAGLAVGAAGAAGAGGLIGVRAAINPPQLHVWELAVAAMILQSLRDMIGFCARAAAPPPALPHGPPLPLDEPADFAISASAGTWPGTGGGNGTSGAGVGRRRRSGWPARLARKARRLVRGGLRWAAEIISFQPGERVAVIGVTAIVAGARMTFLVLLAWGLLATCLTVISQVVRALRATGGPVGGQTLVVYRDDGFIAQSLGKFVNGQLPPLLPAIVGVTVATVLCVVGVAKLPGAMVFAPVAVMALTALGAAHPHGGRIDWLVPPLLQLGEYVFLVALALAHHVPPPLVFALIAVIAAHHYDTRYRVRGQPGRGGAEHETAGMSARAAPAMPGWTATAGLGWEGRMLAAALGAVLGFEVFAFAVLAVYLWVLFGWESLTAWLGTTRPAQRIHRAGFGGTMDAAARGARADDGGGR